MPMLLRSNRSTRGRQVESIANRRRSTRLRQRTAYEDSDESDVSVQSPMMESHPSGHAGMEEDAAEEADVIKELKHCSVVLDLVWADEKPEGKEDMNRKRGKPASRIPTFHKRPANVSQNTEPSVPKKDAPAHVAPPYEKAGDGRSEAIESKLPDVRALLQPLVHAPNMSSEAPSAFSSTEPAAAAADTSLRTTHPDRGLQCPFMTVSPRPSLRAGGGLDLPEHDESKTFGVHSETIPDPPLAHLHPEASISQKPPEERCKVPEDISPYADTKQSESAETLRTAEASQEEAIMGEVPPWETEQTEIIFESKDGSSSSEVDCEDDLGEEPHTPPVSQPESSSVAEERAKIDESTSPVAPEKPAKASSTKSAKGRRCFSFILFCLVPTVLLLGGFGHHVWHYGLPMSVAQLSAQLQLHMLEGFGLLPEPCSADCRVHLVESVPIGLFQSPPSSRWSIADSWLHLLDRANSSVHIAAFYFTLRRSDSSDSSDSQGRMVFEQLKRLEAKGVKLQIAVNGPQASTLDTTELAATGAEVREVELMAVTGGVVHTKLWVVDQKHLYVGSANMDWRSLTQVKEVGLSVEDCSCLAQDAFRIFGVYWSLADAPNGSLPPYWPARLSALSSSQNPLRLNFNGVPAQVYLSSSPPQVSARGRTDDLSAILSVIDDAQKFLYISVMDYLPLSEFTKPLRFWPAIDSALRAAACTREVQVRLLVSCWKHSPAAMFTFLQSLQVLSRPSLRCDIDVKVFTVPSTAEQMKIPFARVNHAKYMVTDRVVYIGTSNWSENYFTQTAGVGLVVNQTGSEVKGDQETLQRQAEELFVRDWTSPYASTLSTDDVDVCPGGRP